MPPAGPTRHSPSSFQRLALATTATTYFLILVGGLVRASGAGLGCPDWPRCFGSWVPPASVQDLPPQFDPSQFNATLMWTEYLNRLLGVTVGILIFATLISAIRHHRHDRRILWSTAAAFLLVGFEGWLGGVVVEQELAPWIVSVHLLVALVIVSLLLYATVYVVVGQPATPNPERHSRRTLSLAAAVLIGVTVVQVIIGAQVRGGIDHALDAGIAREQALATVGAYDMWHRNASLVVLGVALVTLLVVWSKHAHERAVRRTTYATVGLIAAQLALGLVMAYITLAPAAQVLHLTLASLLLGAETVLFLLARWLPGEATMGPSAWLGAGPTS